jgi:hypothetical protein
MDKTPGNLKIFLLILYVRGSKEISSFRRVREG